MGYGSQWATAGILGDGRGTQTRREQGRNHKDFQGKRLPGGRDSQCKVPEAGEGPVHSGRVRRPERLAEGQGQLWSSQATGLSIHSAEVEPSGVLSRGGTDLIYILKGSLQLLRTDCRDRTKAEVGRPLRRLL